MRRRVPRSARGPSRAGALHEPECPGQASAQERPDAELGHLSNQARDVVNGVESHGFVIVPQTPSPKAWRRGLRRCRAECRYVLDHREEGTTRPNRAAVQERRIECWRSRLRRFRPAQHHAKHRGRERVNGAGEGAQGSVVDQVMRPSDLSNNTFEEAADPRDRARHSRRSAPPPPQPQARAAR